MRARNEPSRTRDTVPLIPDSRERMRVWGGGVPQHRVRLPATPTQVPYQYLIANGLFFFRLM